jgi:hypothetical protein
MRTCPQTFLIAWVVSLESKGMSFFLAILIWLIMGAVLVLGVTLAVKGTFWLVILGMLAFVFAVAKIGCLSH